MARAGTRRVLVRGAVRRRCRLRNAARMGAVGIVALTSAVASPSCTNDVDVGRMQPAPITRAVADAGDAAACVVVPCQGRILQCGDCLDNDVDGVADSADSECLGACDNTEDSLYGGVTVDLSTAPGANNAPCVMDCYFDQDTGSGNDGCVWSHTCDPLSVAPDYPPSGTSKCASDPAAVIPGTRSTCAELLAAQSAACQETCLPLTPNGCDCFGCCELPPQSGSFVWLGSTRDNLGSCTLATASDPSRCRPCTPVPSCFNPCSPCEACVGASELTQTCTASAERCPAGAQPCGQPGDAACGGLQYCITGCCADVPL